MKRLTLQRRFLLHNLLLVGGLLLIGSVSVWRLGVLRAKVDLSRNVYAELRTIRNVGIDTGIARGLLANPHANRDSVIAHIKYAVGGLDQFIQVGEGYGPFEPHWGQLRRAGLRLLEQRPHPVIIVDLNLPVRSGMDLLQTVHRRWPATQAIILTGFGDLDAARQAIRLDVVDFLTKPCALGDLEIALGRAFQRLRDVHPTALAPEWEADDNEPASPIEPDASGDSARATSMSLVPAREPVPSSLEFNPREGSVALSMEDVERRTILAALEKHAGNRHATAEELGISLRKLYYRLAQYQKSGLLEC